MSDDRHAIFVIAGPTAVGKTELALRVAEQVPAEIVSADSMAVYEGLDIGTAKPTLQQRHRAHFHLIDYVPPEEPYSLGRFQADAAAAIEDIAARRRLPIVCGGTGLYVRALVQGFSLPREGGDDLRRETALRSKIEARLEREGLEALADELVGIDPDAATSVDLRNPRRVVRALEIVTATGKAVAEARGRAEEAPYRAKCFVVTCSREVLYRRIDRRVDEMMAAGWVEEVKGLLGRLRPLDGARDLRPESTAMQAIGYRHLAAYLRGEGGLGETVAAIKRDTRRFAKRQMTWWRREEGCSWLGWETAQDFAAIEEVLVREAREAE